MAKNKKAADKAAAKRRQKANMDKPHAELIADAEATCKKTEALWKKAKEQAKAAKDNFGHAVDRLRKLAEEVTEKDLFAPKDRA